MPSSTYFRLPKEKQDRIYDAAVREFAAHRYKEVSINRIVKEAMIPRGSFYQYFEGKEDLLYYILEQISKEKMALFSRRTASPDRSFFDTLPAMVPAVMEWARQHPLYYQIGLRLTEEDEQWGDQFLSQFVAGRQVIISMLEQDQERGLIRKDVDLNLFANMYLACSRQILASYYQASDDEASILSTLNHFLDILKYGVAADRR